jgi:hypothetical protein
MTLSTTPVAVTTYSGAVGSPVVAGEAPGPVGDGTGLGSAVVIGDAGGLAPVRISHATPAARPT